MVNKLLRIDRPTGPPNPFECYLLLVCVVQGVAVLTGAAQPSAIRNALSPLWFHLWAVMLAGGGIVSLAGLFWPLDAFTGVEVKRCGLVAVGFTSLAYGVALAGIGPAGYVASASSIGFACASFVRVTQISRALREAREAMSILRAPPDEEGPP